MENMAIEFDIRKGNHNPNKINTSSFLDILIKRMSKYGEPNKNNDIQSVSIHDIKSFKEYKNNNNE